MNSPFSIGESIRFGWKKLRQHSKLVFQVILTLIVVQIAYAIVLHVLPYTLLGAAITALLILFMLELGVGATVISLKLAREEETHYADLFPSVTLTARYILAELMAVVLSLLPFVGLLLVGIFITFGVTTVTHFSILLLLMGLIGLFCTLYLILRFSMVRFVVVDGGHSMESLGHSARLTAGVKWRLLGLILLMVVLNIIGFLLLLVGLLVTIPVTLIAYAHVYQLLKARVEGGGEK